MPVEDPVASHLRDKVEDRAWQRVAARRRRYTQDWWTTYEDLLQRLPQWIRHNGVRLTLDYLALLMSRPAKAGPAAAVLEDWAQHRPGDDQRTLAGRLGALHNNSPDATEMVFLHRTALRDAQALRRYAVLMPQALIEAGAAWDGPQLTNPPALAAPPNWNALRSDCRHPGLAWRYVGELPNHEGPAQAETYRLKQVELLISVSEEAGRCKPYELQYKRRKKWLTSRQAHLCEARLTSRLFTALGDKGVFETQVLLHPTHGLPFLSSTQLKAALRNHLQDRLSHLAADKQQAWAGRIEELLGSADNGGGLLTFHDAWWVPNSSPKTGSVVGDIDTPHHSRYQRGQTYEARDTDSPEPNPQTGVAGSLLLAVDPLRVSLSSDPVAKEMDWGQRALRWLGLALATRGVGGRVRAGAGRFEAPVEAQSS